MLAALGSATLSPVRPLALLFINIADPFELQTRLGFEVSATFFQRLTERFGLALGERGSALRVGDASFCVLIHAIRNGGHAILAAEKLANVIEEAMAEAALTATPSVNVGIALYPRHATNAATLLRNAQLAAAAARKRTARFQIFDESCAEQVLTPWDLRDAFAEALRSGGLEVRYQPKVRVADGRAAGVEALMRWMRDGRLIASPDVFIPLAEETGLMQETTWYALSNSLRQAAAYGNLPVAVNITPGTLHHHDFMEMISSAMSTWSVSSGGLTLEITEGALIADFEEANKRLTKLRELGVRVSIDDFGTGYSSLSYFKKISADEIKIDKSFVLRMLDQKTDQLLVETIIRLARQFRLDVVAEGVEDQLTLEMLARLGCDYAQGYLFSPALDGEQLGAWLRGNSGRS